MEGEGEDEHRHRCLVRHVLKWRMTDRDAAHKFLASWGRRYPTSPLERDVKSQWAKGNRGAWGDWR